MEKLNRIKEVLECRGTTQTWLAEQMGRHFSTINAYCSQQRPNLSTLSEIGKILNIDLKDLIELRKQK
jgi:transcriptional regulator with XRE-family HTH domain